MEVLEKIEGKRTEDVRLVSFNINGFRTLFHYHPWSKLRTLGKMFEAMQADIITLQELKLTPKDIDNSVAKMEGYYSFITVPSMKKGYSGVGVYVRIPKEDEPHGVKSSLKVVKAEEGITGILTSHDTRKKYLESENGIGGYPSIEPDVASMLDSEGRSIVVEFANNTVVISVYCPANSMGTEEGEHFRIQFIEVLLSRVRNLKTLGKHVVLMGDINISRDLIDSADSLSRFQKEGLLIESDDENFERVNSNAVIRFIRSSIPKIMLNELLIDSLDKEDGSDRILIDTTRKIQGRKKGLYTVWNTILNSRPRNFGSRIDLILTTETLGSKVTNAGIWPFLMGSDHCPIFADINTESFHCDNLDIAIPKLEAKYVYKLTSRSIDMMFANLKRKTPPSEQSSSLDISTSQVKRAKSGVQRSQSQNVSRSQNSISSFFTRSRTGLESDSEPVTESPESGLDKRFQPTIETCTVTKSPSLKLSNGKFLLPSVVIPNCKHDEPCVLKTAKTSENKGKKFWSCAKSAGTVTKQEDEQNFRCDFFQWK